MKRSFRGISVVLALVALAVGSIGMSTAQESEAESSDVTLAGLLAMDDEGGYVLVEGESGEEITLEGEGLADYVDSTVEVTGGWATDDEDNHYFYVAGIERVE